MDETPLKTDKEIAAARIGAPEVLDAPITLADYDPAWPALYEREAARIRAVLRDRALLVEHVGSTAVPRIAAKPRIDVLLAVADSSDEASYVPALENAGYVLHIREPGWHEHRAFNGPDTDLNLHVFSDGCVEIERMLRFRDHLRRDKADRLLYERTKRVLTRRTWKYGQHYADAKTTIVEEILARAGIARRRAHEWHCRTLAQGSALVSVESSANRRRVPVGAAWPKAGW